ncbi:capping protein, partial [Mono Lake orbivirus]
VEPHTVVVVSPTHRRFLRDVHLPVWRPASSDLNELWRQNGRFTTDVYCDGTLEALTVRQARAHGCLFVGARQDRFRLRDTQLPPDIIISRASDAKDFETQIGNARVRLRRRFGNALRDYAWTRAEVFNGSEVETVAKDVTNGKILYGLPPLPPLASPRVERDWDVFSFSGDSPVDEKLVSLLDYTCYRVDNVIYVGAGDGRTLQLFFRKDAARAQRIHWTLVDPITPHIGRENVRVENIAISHACELLRYRRQGKTALIWDVRRDRGTMTDPEWDEATRREDALGRAVAAGNADWIELSNIKLRVPPSGTLSLTASCVTFQPGAPADMFELRVIYSTQRPWLPIQRLDLNLPWIRDVIPLVHGRDRGRRLRSQLIQYLHVERRDAFQVRQGPRADLFYLTNAANRGRDPLPIALESEIATLWASHAPLYDYDDYAVDRAEVTLRCSTDSHMVVDGLGFLLLLMLLGELPAEYSFDPLWAAQFLVVFRRRDVPSVPDVWLCRFIGLRVLSSSLRLRTPIVHAAADAVKRLGLDVSGHLFVTLISGSYAVDLHTWFKMIIHWSSQPEAEKRRRMQEVGAEVIEWRDDYANKAWHKPEDLVAALNIFSLLRPTLRVHVEARLRDLRMIERTPGTRRR